MRHKSVIIVASVAMLLAGCERRSAKTEAGAKPEAAAEASAPAPASVMDPAALEAMALGGKIVFDEINLAYLKRGKNAWPKSQTAAGAGFDDSGAYFKELLLNAGEDSGATVGYAFDITGDGAPLWSIALDVTRKTPKGVPVLISANFDCTRLPASWDGDTPGADEVLPIGTCPRIDDGGIVVIKNDGSAVTLTRDRVTLRNIYGSEPVQGLPRRYLTPGGVAETGGE